MVCHLIELFDAFDVGANDSFLFFEDTDSSIDLDVTELLVVEVSEGGRHLVLAFMVKEDVESTRIIVDFKLGAHWLFYSTE